MIRAEIKNQYKHKINYIYEATLKKSDTSSNLQQISDDVILEICSNHGSTLKISIYIYIKKKYFIWYFQFLNQASKNKMKTSFQL